MISMWTVTRFFACFCTIVLTINDIKTHCALPPPKEDYLSISIKKLASDIHEYVTKNKGSYVFSPYGLSHAMNVLFLGAVGETRSQIRKGIFNGLRERLVGAHEGLISINSRRNQSLQVQMASLIAVHSNVNVLPSYKQDIANFNAIYDQLNFMEKSTETVINNYVERRTHGFIPIFFNSTYKFKPPSLLANAIAFRISWDHFDKAIRQQLPFKNIGGTTKNVTMLTVDGIFEFKKFTFASMLRLPYGDQYYMYIILPDTPEMLTKVENKIFREFDGQEYHMNDKQLQVTIPSFKLDTFHNLNEAVKGLGVRNVFMKDGSGLSKITNDNGFFLGDILQRAVIDFGGGCNVPCAKPEIVEKSHVFLVDQPFFFVIRDKAHEVHLLRGRVDHFD